jgi:hypothetical protein
VQYTEITPRFSRLTEKPTLFQYSVNWECFRKTNTKI